jgi:hypothetical protein
MQFDTNKNMAQTTYNYLDKYLIKVKKKIPTVFIDLFLIACP